jgi:hypothetical protein
LLILGALFALIPLGSWFSHSFVHLKYHMMSVFGFLSSRLHFLAYFKSLYQRSRSSRSSLWYLTPMVDHHHHLMFLSHLDVNEDPRLFLTASFRKCGSFSNGYDIILFWVSYW